MGQQQLLLTVLVLVITALAITVAVFVLNEWSDKHNVDQLAQTTLGIATEATMWASKPALMGGGNTSAGEDTYARLTWDDLGRQVNDQGFYETLNGYFSLDVTDGGKTLEVRGVSPTFRNCVTVTAVGLRNPSISTDVNRNCDRRRP